MPQSMGSQIVRRDLVTEQQLQYCTPQLGKGEDGGVSRKFPCARGQDLMWLGSVWGQGQWQQRPRGGPQTRRPAGLGEMARR